MGGLMRILAFSNYWDNVCASKGLPDGEPITNLLNELKTNFPKTFLEFQPDEKRGARLTDDELAAYRKWRTENGAKNLQEWTRPAATFEERKPAPRVLKPQSINSHSDSYYYDNTANSTVDFCPVGGAIGFEGLPETIRSAIGSAMAECTSVVDDDDWFELVTSAPVPFSRHQKKKTRRSPHRKNEQEAA